MSLYLRSVDHEVIATCEHNDAGWLDWRTRALAYAAERGADSFYPIDFAGRWDVFALPGQPTGFGQWTKPDHYGRSKPYANNRAEQEALSQLTFFATPIPGLPDVARSARSDETGRTWLMYPRPFAHNGVAYLRYRHQPQPSDLAKIGDQWTECLASVYHAAREAFEAAEGAKAKS